MAEKHLEMHLFLPMSHIRWIACDEGEFAGVPGPCFGLSGVRACFVLGQVFIVLCLILMADDIPMFVSSHGMKKRGSWLTALLQLLGPTPVGLS